MKKVLVNFAGIVFAICFSVNLSAQTAGTLTFKFTQVAHSPCYSASRNVLAVWIQTNANGFVKTKLKNGGLNSTSDHLPAWSVNAGGTTTNMSNCNVTDATTGATLASFGAKTIVWDGKNVNGASNGVIVADGVYKVTIQETWNHGTGSTVTKSYTFTKGPVADHQTPANDANFTSITLDWVPAGPSLTVTTSAVSVKCSGGNNGSATATATGTAPYTYSWSTSPIQTTVTATGLSAGTYTVTVKDANATTATSAVTVTQPAALTASANPVNVSCNGGSNGSATATVTGGTSAYSYLWSNGKTTSAAIGLSAGTYSLTVTDANGCTKVTSVTISQPSALIASANGVNVSCNGGSNGSSTVSATGGTSAYTYLWSNGKTTSTATGLSAGSYSVTVTDANGCTKNTSVTITQPATALTSTVGTTNANCGTSNGTASVTANGGTGTYTYLWSNGKTTTNITGLSASSYSVTVTDVNGCTFRSIANVLNSGAPTATVTPTNVTGCFGGNNGSATVSASGGTGTLTYSWNTSPVKTTTTVTGLSAGTYIVTVTDGAGCVVQTSVIISQPTIVTATATPTNASSCAVSDGSITSSVSGGTSPYTYLWSNGKTTATITGLSSGTYTLTATDNKGCTKSAVATVSCVASTLSVTTSSVNVKCNGGNNGSATALASGTPPYSYTWSTVPVQTTATATGLSAGTYIVTVKDAANITKTASATVVNPAALVSNTTPTNASSCSASDGNATSSVSGGTSPYAYLWSNGKTTSSITGLAVGNYTLTVTDANGCKKSTSTAVNFAGSLPIPLVEGFESSSAGLPANWTLDNPDADAGWEVLTTVALTGSNCIGFNNCDGNGAGIDMTGTKDKFITSAYDFTTATASASLSFDVAYAVLNYKGLTYPDSLAVYSSSDCGTTWNQIYLKGGGTLSTSTTTISCWTPSSTADWRTDNISLSNLAGKSSVMFAFENRSDWGEWIYIDNININAVTGIGSIDPLSGFNLYPNPATTSFTIQGASNAEKIHYEMYNVVGAEVRVGDISSVGGFFNEKININDISKGMYFIKLSDGKNNSTKKLNVQ